MQSVHTETKGNSGLFRGVFQGVVTMVQQEGVLSLWRGLAPTLWRDVPFSGRFDTHTLSLLYRVFSVAYTFIHAFSIYQLTPCFRSAYLAIYWMGYENIKRRLVAWDSRHSKPSLNEFEVAFASGALSGMVSIVTSGKGASRIESCKFQALIAYDLIV